MIEISDVSMFEDSFEVKIVDNQAQKKIRIALSDPEQDRAGRMSGRLRLITLRLCVYLLVL